MGRGGIHSKRLLLLFLVVVLIHFVHEIGHKDESAGANLCYVLATRFCICTIVVKDRTKDNYDLVRTFNQFCGVEKCDAII